MSRSAIPGWLLLWAIACCAPAAAGPNSILPGQEWRYTGVAVVKDARPTYGAGPGERQLRCRLTIAVLVLGRVSGGLEVAQFHSARLLSPDSGPRTAFPSWSALWMSELAEATAPLRKAPFTPYWMAETLRLPAPIRLDERGGHEERETAYLFGIQAPRPRELQLRVVGTAMVGSHHCWKVERTFPNEAAQRGLLLARYVERFWLDQQSGSLVRYEAEAEQKINDGDPGRRLTARLELRRVRRLRGAQVQQCRAQARWLDVIARRIADETDADHEQRLSEADRHIVRFARAFPGSPYRAAVLCLTDWLRRERIALQGQRAERERAALVGQLAPSLTLRDLEGQERSLADYRGKIVLLNFFAAWCASCNEEAPQLEREYWQRLRDRGVLVVGISCASGAEPAEAARRFRAKHQLSFPILLDSPEAGAAAYELLDPEGKVHSVAASRAAAAFRVFDFPTNVLIDVDGRIRYIAVANGLTDAVLRRILKELVGD